MLARLALVRFECHDCYLPYLPFSLSHLLVGKANSILFLTIWLVGRAHAPAVPWVGSLGNVEYISFNRIEVGIFLAVVVEVPSYVLLDRAHGGYI